MRERVAPSVTSWIPTPHAAAAEVERRAKELVHANAVDGRNRPIDSYIDAVLDAWLAPLVHRSPPAPASPASVDRLGSADGQPGDTARGESRLPEPPPEVGPSRLIGLKLLTALLFVGDIANFYIALAVVGNAAPTTTLLVVTALGAGALGLAHTAGRMARDRAEGRAGLGRAVAWLLAGLVLLLGVTAAAVRLAAPPPDIISGGDLFGGAEAAGPDPATVNLLLSALLLVLYLASTTMAAFIGYLSRDPVATAAHRRDRTRGRSRRRAERIERAQRDAEQARLTAIDQYRACAEHLRCQADQILSVAFQNPGFTTSQTTRPRILQGDRR